MENSQGRYPPGYIDHDYEYEPIFDFSVYRIRISNTLHQTTMKNYGGITIPGYVKMSIPRQNLDIEN